jgi:diaminopimelate epimerase
VVPAGVNVEFVLGRGPGRIAMRVHERGVGETRSCGTGACAAAVAAGMWWDPGRPLRYEVEVPGGRLTVTETPDGHLTLTGNAVLVATGRLDPGWVAAARAADDRLRPAPVG